MTDRTIARRAKKVTAFLVLPVVGVLVPQTPAAAERFLAHEYVGTGFNVASQQVIAQSTCTTNLSSGLAPDLGGGCFRVGVSGVSGWQPAPEGLVDISLDDLVAEDVVGYYATSGSGAEAAGYFCDSAEDVEVPAGTYWISVYVVDDLLVEDHCPDATETPPLGGTVAIYLHD